MAVQFIKEGISASDAAVADRKVRDTVSDILDNIRLRGDEAVREYSTKFDRWSPPS